MWVTISITTIPLYTHSQILIYGLGRGKQAKETAISMLTAHMWPERWKMKLQNCPEIRGSGVLNTDSWEELWLPGSNMNLRPSFGHQGHHATERAVSPGNQRPVWLCLEHSCAHKWGKHMTPLAQSGLHKASLPLSLLFKTIFLKWGRDAQWNMHDHD